VGIVTYLISTKLENGTSFFLASVAGVALFSVVDILKQWLEGTSSPEIANTTSSMMKAGLGTFLFLEVLDSSFSFDGVIAAFAISTNILVVASGLGIGAIFVRSATIMLDDTEALTIYKYLEHAAFWAIGWLALCILVGVFYHIPDWIIGGVGLSIIIAGVIHSKLSK
jgi:hypothetical protein